MIEKRIHYCWFGSKLMPELEKKCIESWKKYLPDYELFLWNEDSFDIQSHQFVKEAYEAGQYAFVTDYVRFYALYRHGGIYMDTDVEVIKPLDKFLIEEFFIGLEKPDSIQTGVIGSKSKNLFIKRILDLYDNQKFVLDNGKFNMIPNPKLITPILLEEYGLVPENVYQNLLNEVTVYPTDYFCAKDYRTGRLDINDNTHTIHHFSGSWFSKTDKLKKRVKNIIGIKNTEYVIDLKERLKQKYK